MKEIIALAALTGLLAIGCAPRDSHQGGDLGTTDGGRGSGAGSSDPRTGSPSPNSPTDEATPPAESRSPDQPSGLRPPPSEPDDSSPDGFFPRKKNTSITI
ncbi:MAG TPA: hypothetical protein VNT26_04865 [Candidatus Sulfotelmatobacter sp.]|nr:hypothetical protein [Candidatus Sulfotelmatobacter sp.]